MFMFLKELANLGAPSGFEDSVRNFLKEHAIADEIHTDSIGNLICHKKGTGKKVMVTAHMDEVGLLITGITDSGYLKFNALGGIETAVLCSKKVYIGDNSIIGENVKIYDHNHSFSDKNKLIKEQGYKDSDLAYFDVDVKKYEDEFNAYCFFHQQ